MKGEKESYLYNKIKYDHIRNILPNIFLSDMSCCGLIHYEAFAYPQNREQHFSKMFQLFYSWYRKHFIIVLYPFECNHRNSGNL